MYDIRPYLSAQKHWLYISFQGHLAASLTSKFALPTRASIVDAHQLHVDFAQACEVAGVPPAIFCRLDKSHLTVLAMYRHDLDMRHACPESSLKVALAYSPSIMMAFQPCCCGSCATLEPKNKLLLSACACASVLDVVTNLHTTKVKASYRTVVVCSQVMNRSLV